MQSPARDIYTTKDIIEDSSEHVLLNALGGKLELKGIIDKNTNDVFGRTIDSELLKMVEPFRVIPNISKGDGGSPPSLRVVTSEDGRRVDILPGGMPRLAHPSLETQSVDGAKFLKASFRSIEEAQRHIRNWANKHAPGLDVTEILKQATEVSDHPSYKLELELNQGGQRCIAKMVCNLFAAYNQDIFLMSDFDLIRNFVLDGSVGDKSINLIVQMMDPVVSLDWSKAGYSCLDHIVGFDIIDNRVVGTVVLFGYLQFCVQLGTVSLVPKKARSTYRVNPFLGVERVDHDLTILDAMQEIAPTANKRDALAKGVVSVLEFMKDPLKLIDIKAIISRHVSLGMTFTEEVATKVSQDFGEEVADYYKVHGFLREVT